MDQVNYTQEEADFMKEKSLSIVNKNNNLCLRMDDVEIQFFRLDGISNKIYRVAVKPKNEENSHDLFFKIFGRISSIVDRNLETSIIEQFSSRSLGPKVYETDYKVYRVEEYIQNLIMLSREKMFVNEVLDKMLENFAIFNIIGDINYFANKIGNKQKSEFFPMLLNDSEKLNFITFTVKKMKSSAVKSLAEFKIKFAEKEAENLEGDKSRVSEFKKKLETIEHYVENLEDIFYKCCPNQGIFVLSHNDAHLINIMHTKNIDKVYLFDHEYSCYNFMGFDIANYIIESLFYLADNHHPYYRYHRDELKTLLNDNFFTAYLKFFELIKNKYHNEFKEYPEFERLLETAKTKEYFMQVMSLSSIMWSIFAVIYLDFESVWDKSAYDYFNFAIDRLAIYNEFLKYELKH